MTNERWEELVEGIKQKSTNYTIRHEEWEVEYGEARDGASVDILEFTQPGAGKFKLVRENTPLVLEKKHHYSHRQGDTARTEYVLSDTELSHKLKVYKEDDYGDWQEITPAALGLN